VLVNHLGLLLQFATAFGLACFYGQKCVETGPAGCKGLVEVHGNVDRRYKLG
jgi:hypothetical protein